MHICFYTKLQNLITEEKKRSRTLSNYFLQLRIIYWEEELPDLIMLSEK